MYFDETKDERAARKAKREEKAKQKGKEKAKAVEVEKVRLGKRNRSGVGEYNQPRSFPNPGQISTTDSSILRAQFVTASFITPMNNSSTVSDLLDGWYCHLEIDVKIVIGIPHNKGVPIFF